MKKITIIGDSFGCGEWQTKDSTFLSDGDFYYKTPIWWFSQDYVETHPGLEHFLEEDGNVCHNISSGGSSNIHQLKRLASSLMIDHPRHEESRFLNPDYIIWFFSEPLRDYPPINGNMPLHHNMGDVIDEVSARINKHNFDIYKINDELIKITMEFAQKIYDATKIPFIIVESLGTTKEMEKEFSFCKYKINNWVGNMFDGIKLPILLSTRIIKELDDKTLSNIGYETIEKLLIGADDFYTLLKGRKDFPDGGHPNRDRHKELFNKITELIR